MRKSMSYGSLAALLLMAGVITGFLTGALPAAPLGILENVQAVTEEYPYSVEFTAPLDGQTFYIPDALNSAAQTFTANLTVKVSGGVSVATQLVDYYMPSSQVATKIIEQFARVGTSTTAPDYRSRVKVHVPYSEEQGANEFLVKAIARGMTVATKVYDKEAEGYADFRVIKLRTGGDDGQNPAAAPLKAIFAGGTWINTFPSLEGLTERPEGGIRQMAAVGIQHSADGSVKTTLTLVDPFDPTRFVEVSVPNILVPEGYTGVFMLVSADTLERLLGEDDANWPNRIGLEPSEISENGKYIAFILLLTNDGGATWIQPDAALLAANPIGVTIHGLGDPLKRIDLSNQFYKWGATGVANTEELSYEGDPDYGWDKLGGEAGGDGELALQVVANSDILAPFVRAKYALCGGRDNASAAALVLVVLAVASRRYNRRRRNG